MAPTKHAMLGPSSSHRWLNCTPSARLESKFPESTSVFAEEGTLAHAIVEERLNRIIKGKPRGQTSAKLKKHRLYKPEMEAYADSYVDTVVEIYDELQKQGAMPVLLSETEVDYSEWVPDGTGTTDTTIIAFGTMYVFDFKYGKGVRVNAVDNPQIRLYALGAWSANSILWDVDKVRMYIVQPRVADGTTFEEMPIDELLTWANEYVKPRAALASTGAGKTVEGEWCKFCKAKNICKARAIHFLEYLKESENDPRTLEISDLARLLPIAESMSGWAKEIKTYMLDQAVNHGIEYPGYKLVEGRSRRVVTNPQALAEKLIAAGYKDIFTLKGITDLESVVGAKEFSEIAQGLVDKPAGAPTLVPDTDKRDKLSNNMFDDDFEEAE